MAEAAGAEPEENRRASVRRGLQIGAAVLAIAVVSYFGYIVLRQEKGPSGASIPATMAELPPIQRNEVTITCGPEIVGARGDLFGTSLYVPRWRGDEHHAVDWNTEFLEGTEEALREHIKLAGPRIALRFGHQPFDGFFDADGRLMQGYHWRDALDPASGQMSVDGYMDYVRRVNAEAQVVVNFGTGTAAEAADLVAYMNGTDPADPMVTLRHDRGRIDPYGVAIWEIGNEPWGDWSPGYDGLPDARLGSRDGLTLARRQAEFAARMRSRSPSPVKLYAPITDWELSAYPTAVLERMIAATASEVDGYALHFYAARDAKGKAIPPTESIVASAPRLAASLERLKILAKSQGGGKSLDIAVTEWAGSAYPTVMGQNWLTGLVLVDSTVVMAESGVASANYFAASAAPGDAGGYSYWLDGKADKPAPTLVATQIAARHIGRELLATSTTGIPAISEGAPTIEFPSLGARCFRRDYDASLVVVNRTSRPRQSNVALDFPVTAPIQQTQLVAPTAAETVDVAAITYQPATKFSIELPPYSATFLRIPAT